MGIRHLPDRDETKEDYSRSEEVCLKLKIYYFKRDYSHIPEVGGQLIQEVSPF